MDGCENCAAMGAEVCARCADLLYDLGGEDAAAA